LTYTFAEAKRKLAGHISAYGLADLSGAVNEALDELSQTKSWQRMRKVIRFTVAGERFALPQDCGRLIRCAIDGVPVSVHGQDYEFLHSGPGDLDYAGEGYAPLSGVVRAGIFPTMNAMAVPGRLAAFSATPPEDPLTVTVRNAVGEISTVQVAVNDGAASVGATATAYEYTEVLSVTLPPRCEAYVTLYGISDDGLEYLSRMHPRVLIPEFVRYRLPGFSTTADASYRMLAEVGIKFLPLVADEDPVPFSSLRPVQYMLQSMAAMDTGEIKEADDFRSRAEMELVRREDTENERQGLTVLNPLYEGSAGQSAAYWEGA